MMTKEQIEQMAEIKGLPSVTGEGTDERYSDIKSASNIQAEFVNDGSVPESIREIFVQTCNDFGAGVYKDAQEAAKAFVEQCA